jgi:hypothetical protein
LGWGLTPMPAVAEKGEWLCNDTAAQGRFLCVSGGLDTTHYNLIYLGPRNSKSCLPTRVVNSRPLRHSAIPLPVPRL